MGETSKMAVIGLSEREAMELAYGLLWLAPTNDRRIRDARLALGNALGFEGKKAGVARAQDALALAERS